MFGAVSDAYKLRQRPHAHYMARPMMHCNRNCATQNKYYNRTAAVWADGRILAANFRRKNITLDQRLGKKRLPRAIIIKKTVTACCGGNHWP
jgi:hypothetical protein